MLVYNSSAYPQAQSGSSCALCGVESFKQVRFHLRTHAVPAVSQRNPYAGLTRVGMCRVPLSNQDAAAVAGGVKSVAD